MPTTPMRLAFRLSGLLVACALFVAPAHLAAQTPCENGTADGYECDRVTLLAHLDFDALTFGYDYSIGRRGNDLWGWTDPETGTEYALVGHYDGVAFVDLSDPTAPLLVGVLPTEVPGAFGNRWRDIKTRGSYAFIVSEATQHGMQVFDLTRLRNVTSPPATFDADAIYDGIGGAHNVIAGDDLDVAIIVGSADFTSRSCNTGGLILVNVRNPLAPALSGCFDADGYTHDAQCLVYDGPDPDYQGRTVCLSSNTSFLSISDITTATSPRGISTAAYPDPGYTHQGWLTDDKRFFLMNDELDEARGLAASTRTIVMNVEDLDNPFYVGAYSSGVTSSDHNLYVRDNVIYQANYESGLRVFRFDPANPTDFELLGFFDSFPGTNISFDGAWSVYPFFESGVVLLNDRESGLFVLRPEDVGVATEAPLPDATERLSAAYPNPFGDRTTLALTLDSPERVRAEAYDLLGRSVATLLDGTVDAAMLTLDGSALPSGAYVVRVVGETFTETRRVTLTR
ncbi:MAG: choice-of-anchor B family protein [Bacteroidota bacterium]